MRGCLLGTALCSSGMDEVVVISSGSEPPTPEKEVVMLSSDSDVGTPQKCKKTKLKFECSFNRQNMPLLGTSCI